MFNQIFLYPIFLSHIFLSHIFLSPIFLSPIFLSPIFLSEAALALVLHLHPALLAELRLPLQFSPASLATQLRVHWLAAFRAELTVRERAAIRARYADDRLRVSRVGHRVDRRA